MVRFEVEGGVDPLLLVRLEKGDAVATESNAMVAMDRSLTLKGKTRGGFFGSIARKFLNEETFFQQWVEAEDEPGEVMLAPNLPGDVRILDVGDRQYCLSDGAFLASTSEVGITTKAQGLGRALFGGNGGFFIMATEGRGRVVPGRYRAHGERAGAEFQRSAQREQSRARSGRYAARVGHGDGKRRAVR